MYGFVVSSSSPNTGICKMVVWCGGGDLWETALHGVVCGGVVCGAREATRDCAHKHNKLVRQTGGLVTDHKLGIKDQSPKIKDQPEWYWAMDEFGWMREKGLARVCTNSS
uniref:Uncharacterized protein n=1 Tax=Pristionchus pacificus TaxID=54126 RepID=A0A2A6BX01_PRIPA|eukprot:PDM70532.1 hypothetical protein PRIPAC_46778 [Pristionchus pacificus]